MTRQNLAADAVFCTEPQPRPIDLFVPGLTGPQAYALAQLCKRLGWADLRQLAADDHECTLMVLAADRIRGGLEQVGVQVR